MSNSKHVKYQNLWLSVAHISGIDFITEVKPLSADWNKAAKVFEGGIE